LIQFIGNIFFAYQYIDINGQSFKDWVDMVDPLVSFLGVESGDMVGHKRFLALFAGGMLPLISLSFLHMLVKFEEDDKNKTLGVKNSDHFIDPVLDIDELSLEAGKKELEIEKEKYTPTEQDLLKLQEELDKLQKAKFNLVENNPEKEEDLSILVENNLQQEDVVMEPVEEKKILSYLKRDADA
jgi:hypothetical protein